MNIIIVLNYNDYDITLNYLNLISNYKSIDYIIVVDNCSTDDSYFYLKSRETSKIHVIQTEKNRGYASGNNAGIKYAEKNFNPKNIIISNPDIVVSELSISKLINLLDENENVAATSGLIYDSGDNIASNFAWRLPKYKDFLLDSFLTISKINTKINKKSQFYKKEQLKVNSKKFTVEVLSGCFFIIKHSVLKEVGYFDEETFLYNEENILSFKIKELGYKQCILLTEKIVHLQGISITKNIKSWRAKNQIIFNSEKVYLTKYLKISDRKLKFYKLLFNLGKFEKYIIIKTKTILYGGKK